MKAFDKKDGWSYLLVEGPADGMTLRVNAGSWPTPGDQPSLEAIEFEKHPEGRYERVRKGSMKFNGKQIGVWRYQWTKTK